MNSIPASDIVEILPGVIGTGGNPLALNALFITKKQPSAMLPLQSFGSEDSVAKIFGTASDEYKAAQIYFAGFNNSTALADSLLIASMQDKATSARLIGSEVPKRTTAQMKNINGDLMITVDGKAVSIALKDTDTDTYSPTSYSQIAQDISTALNKSGSCVFDTESSSFTIISATTGVKSAITTATGGLAEFIYLTADLGAQANNGAAADTIEDLLPRIINQTQNFATIMAIGDFTVNEKIAISQWTALQNSRYAHIIYQGGDLAGDVKTLSEAIVDNKLGGTLLMYGDVTHGAFACGYPASLNFDELNGRTNFAFRSQSGLLPSVTDKDTADQLIALGFNFYGAYATANDRFIFANRGSITGDYKWYDSFINQIYFNNQLQLALMTMLTNFKLIPYNDTGRAIHRAAVQDPIDQMVNYGGIQKGVNLSNQQKTQINTEAGFDAASQLQTKGWCLLIGETTAQTRGNRGSMPLKLWYTDGGSVQQVSLPSINVQ